MPETTALGTKSEGMVLGALLRNGYAVLVPFGGGLAYDLVADMAGSLERIQVKTGHISRGCIVFNANSMNRDTKIRKSYVGRADFFGVYCPDNDSVYLIPVEDVGIEGRIRIEPTRNNQASGVRWAEKYLLR